MNPHSPAIMGILNITPDSFSDGGLYNAPLNALNRIHEMIEEGADIIDIGAESTGPGSADVKAHEEIERLKPIIKAIDEEGLQEKVMFSIDTYKSEVAEYALFNGFHMVNDVTALRGDKDMLNMIIKYQPYTCLMYSKDATPRTTRRDEQYDDVMDTVKKFLYNQSSKLIKAGLPKNKIILDPGMGHFVSSIPKYSFEIIDRLDELSLFNHPILIGISRKSCLAEHASTLEEFDEATVKFSLQAIRTGASIVRVHNVKMMREALDSAKI